MAPSELGGTKHLPAPKPTFQCFSRLFSSADLVAAAVLAPLGISLAPSILFPKCWCRGTQPPHRPIDGFLLLVPPSSSQLCLPRPPQCCSVSDYIRKGVRWVRRREKALNTGSLEKSIAVGTWPPAPCALHQAPIH